MLIIIGITVPRTIVEIINAVAPYFFIAMNEDVSTIDTTIAATIIILLKRVIIYS